MSISLTEPQKGSIKYDYTIKSSLSLPLSHSLDCGNKASPSSPTGSTRQGRPPCYLGVFQRFACFTDCSLPFTVTSTMSCEFCDIDHGRFSMATFTTAFTPIVVSGLRPPNEQGCWRLQSLSRAAREKSCLMGSSPRTSGELRLVYIRRRSAAKSTFTSTINNRSSHTPQIAYADLQKKKVLRLNHRSNIVKVCSVCTVDEDIGDIRIEQAPKRALQGASRRGDTRRCASSVNLVSQRLK